MLDERRRRRARTPPPSPSPAGTGGARAGRARRRPPGRRRPARPPAPPRAREGGSAAAAGQPPGTRAAPTPPPPAPPAPRGRAPAPPRGTAGRAAPGRGRGRPPTSARSIRCSTASVPTTIRSAGSSVVEAVTSPTGSPASASSSSRTRLTPARALRKRLDPHTTHTGGRVAAQRGHTRSSSGWCTAASHTAQRASSPHARHASSFARPVRFSTQSTRPPVAELVGQRPGQQAVARVLLSLVHHLDHRPAGPVTGAVGGVELAPPQRLQRRARAGEHARHPGPARPLDGDVARVPGGRLLLLVGLVVLVEHDDARQVADRRPRRRPGADDGRAGGAPAPSPTGCDGHGDARSPQAGRRWWPPSARTGTARGRARGRRRPARRARGWWPAGAAAPIAARRRRPARSACSGGAHGARERRRRQLRRRPGRATPSSAARPGAPGPSPRRPLGQLDQVRRRARARCAWRAAGA